MWRAGTRKGHTALQDPISLMPEATQQSGVLPPGRPALILDRCYLTPSLAQGPVQVHTVQCTVRQALAPTGKPFKAV